MATKLKLRTKPYPHQLKAVRRAVAQGNHAFLFDPRCGKTKAALDAVAVLAHRGQVKRVAIIAPIIASDVWVRQLHEHFTMNYRYLDVWGDRHTRRNRLDPGVAFFFCNTDKLSYRAREGKKKWEHVYADIIERWNPDLIIIDESHRLKRAGGVGASTAWHMVWRLRRDSAKRWPYAWDPKKGPKPWVYLLTGTPNPKGYIDLFAQYRIMDDELLGTAKSDFEENYCIYGKGKRRYTIIRYQNTRQLLSKVRAHSTVVSSEDAGLAGEFVQNPIRLTMPPKVKEIYNRLCYDKLAELKSGEVLDAKNAGVLRLRLLQLTGGFTTSGTQIHDVKLTAFRDFAADLLEQGESLVVGTRFRPEVRAIRDAATKLGFRTAAVYGGTSRADNTEAIAEFQRNGRRTPHCLVFQSEAGSLSIELTAAAEVLFYSLPDRWDTFYQLMLREGGPNQKHWPVRWSALLMRGTVDPSVLDALKDKRDMHAAMMHAPRDFLLGR